MSCFPCCSTQSKEVTRIKSSTRSQQLPAFIPTTSPIKPEPRPEYPKQRWPGPENTINTNTTSKRRKPELDRINTDSSTSNRRPPGLERTRTTYISSSKTVAAETFTFRDLATATKNFRRQCLIGEGGFGRVYKGILAKTGQVVAVKQLDRNGLQGNKEFLVEVLMLSVLHHTNLVNLIGYCADGDQRLLVYEYMPLGCLDDHLLDLTPDQTPLSWFTRMKIALDAAKGIEYLHDNRHHPVIFRDLKTSNILLDNDFNAKVSDFGFAKLGPVGDNSDVSSRVMGTYGYCAPEYQRTGKLTVKSDVYSFGVVLLELITGMRVIDTTRPSEKQNLVTWVQPVLKDPRNYAQLADPLLEGDYPARGLKQAVAIAAMCIQEEPSVRPLMSDVVSALGVLIGTTTIAPLHAAHSKSDPTTPLNTDDENREHKQVVEEAMIWGWKSRRVGSHRSG